MRIAIIEDEQQPLTELTDAIDRYQRETGEGIMVFTFRYAESFLENYKPIYDIVFMDIDLPGLNGMNAAEKLRQFDEHVPLVFVTNMAQFAIKGYEVSAVGYFLKPISYYDLKLKLDRIRKAAAKSAYYFSVPIANGEKRLSTDEVLCIESRGHFFIYHTKDGVFEQRGKLSMQALEKQLEPYGFVRCNVSCLINYQYCRKITADSVTVGDETYMIARTRKKEFREKIEKAFKNS